MTTCGQFCPLCDVTLDLHDGPDSCDYAEAKVRLLESFSFFGGAR